MTGTLDYTLAEEEKSVSVAELADRQKAAPGEVVGLTRAQATHFSRCGTKGEKVRMQHVLIQQENPEWAARQDACLKTLEMAKKAKAAEKQAKAKEDWDKLEASRRAGSLG